MITRSGVACAILTTLLLSSSAFAGEGVGTNKRLGVGVQGGFPGSGLSFNYFLSGKNSLQVTPSLWLNEHWSGLGGRVDYLFWMKPIKSLPRADLLWYFGPGANLFLFSWSGDGSVDSYFYAGAEFPVGLGFRFTRVPVDLNLEAVPVLGILGSGGVDVGFGVAANLNCRYYF